MYLLLLLLLLPYGVAILTCGLPYSLSLLLRLWDYLTAPLSLSLFPLSPFTVYLPLSSLTP